jgi:sugar phosphate permease
MSLDFGGKQGVSTASGVIDGIGAVLAGDATARISIAFGWEGFFIVLAGVALLTSVASAVYWNSQRRVPDCCGTQKLRPVQESRFVTFCNVRS